MKLYSSVPHILSAVLFVVETPSDSGIIVPEYAGIDVLGVCGHSLDRIDLL